MTVTTATTAVLVTGLAGVPLALALWDRRRKAGAARRLRLLGHTIQLDALDPAQVTHLVEFNGQFWVLSGNADEAMDLILEGRGEESSALCIWPRVAKSTAVSYARMHGVRMLLLDRSS